MLQILPSLPVCRHASSATYAMPDEQILHSPMIGVGIIGYGYWGPNLVRTFSELTRARVVAVSDFDVSKLESAERRYPAVRTTTKCQDLVNDPQIDAIAIATPVSTHFELAMATLKAGKHL